MSKTKKFRSYPHYDDYFGFLAFVKQNNIEVSNVDSFLFITKEYLPKWESKDYILFFSTCRNVVESNLIYKSKYNSLKATGGSFKIKLATAVVAEEEDDENLDGLEGLELALKRYDIQRKK